MMMMMSMSPPTLVSQIISVQNVLLCLPLFASSSIRIPVGLHKRYSFCFSGMRLLFILPPLVSFAQTVVSKPWVPWSHDSPPIPLNCLTDAQALDIATRYLSCYNSGAVKSINDLTGIISANFTSYDETGTGPYSDGAATAGIDAFFQSLTASGPSAFGNAVQYPLFIMHDCTRISYRWKFEAWSTGYNA